MTNGLTRRHLGKVLSAAAAGVALPTVLLRPAHAADKVRHGVQIGALGALRTTLLDAGKKNNIAYDMKDFRDSTSALLALEQGELEVANTTVQHLIRAVSEGIPVSWVCGWGGGTVVLVSRKALALTLDDESALRSLVLARRAAGKPLLIGAPSGSINHAKTSVYLKSLALDPEKDVAFVNVPYPNHPRALEAGEIDMAVALPSFAAISITNGHGALYKHLFGGVFGKQEIGFIVSRKLVQEKPDLVQRIVSSHVDAMNLFINDMEKQVEFEKKYSRLPDPVVAMQERDFWRYHYRTDVDAIKRMAREMVELGWVKEDHSGKVEDYVDLSFLAKKTGLSVSELSKW